MSTNCLCRWLVIVFVLSCCKFAAAENGSHLLLVEAESVSDLGGWVVDQQFMDQMGSPFVLAHGLGVPVPDCETEISPPVAGSYRVWVRTRDWVAPWNAPGAPGKFQLFVDDKAIDTIFGAEGAQWHWQDGGVVELGATTKLRIHDLTGFEGRCDAILFSSDKDFIPPDDGQELQALRSKLLGWGNGPQDAGAYDLVVVGGGFAGTCAAITAARLGLTVALVQDRPVLGGNGSSEVRVWPEGFSGFEPYPRVGDVVEELVPYSKLKDHPNPKGPEAFDDLRKTELARGEPNLTLLLEHRVIDGKSTDNSVQSVVAQHTRSGKRKIILGRWFVDSTGDGILGVLVGADSDYTPTGHMGTTNLWSVGETQETEHQIKCLCEDDDPLSFNFTAANSPQPFPRCPWAVDMSKTDFPGRAGTKTFGAKGIDQLGNWFWESGFDKDPVADGEWIRDLNLRAMYGAWDTLKNVDRMHPNHRLKWAAFIAGKRESRRLMGDVVLTAEDFRKGTKFEDAAFPCTWHIDIHSPHPKYFAKDDQNAFFSTFTRGKEFQYKGPYWGPYRCLYSRNIDNLFMAGRDISVSHDGLGAVRVMRTCGMMGEIVGMAATVCKQQNCTPRDVYRYHLPALKKIMIQGAGKKAELSTK